VAKKKKPTDSNGVQQHYPAVVKGKQGFQKGKSGNPGGYSPERHKARIRAREALQALLVKDGHDRLAQIVAEGVMERDPVCLKLAADHLWGKPPQEIIAMTDYSDTELAAEAERRLKRAKIVDAVIDGDRDDSED